MVNIDSPWTPSKVLELRKLWNQVPELSCWEIGRMLGVSKNAVIGKVHRLKLQPRRDAATRFRQKPCR